MSFRLELCLINIVNMNTEILNLLASTHNELGTIITGLFSLASIWFYFNRKMKLDKMKHKQGLEKIAKIKGLANSKIVALSLHNENNSDKSVVKETLEIMQTLKKEKD